MTVFAYIAEKDGRIVEVCAGQIDNAELARWAANVIQHGCDLTPMKTKEDYQAAILLRKWWGEKS